MPDSPGESHPQAPTDPDVTSRFIQLVPLRCQVVYGSAQRANRPGCRFRIPWSHARARGSLRLSLDPWMGFAFDRVLSGVDTTKVPFELG
jgi:hypothetical protein